MVRRSPPSSSTLVAKQWRLCRYRHKRHSFAVHRVERWHREGTDLGTRLPLLSAFMGHADVADTQVYLTMTPERLRLAGERFEREYGSRLADEEERP